MVKEDTPSVNIESSKDVSAREVEEKTSKAQSAEELSFPEGLILKTILVKGAGSERPELGASVVINYVGSRRNTDGVSTVDSKQDGFCFTLGSSTEGVSVLWTRALMTMKKQEKSRFIFREKKKKLNTSPREDRAFEEEEEKIEYEIELVSWMDSQDVTADGGVSKIVLKEGNGAETPGLLSLCFVSYFLKTPDGTCIVGDEDVSKVDTVTLDLSSPETIDGIAEALKTMKRGERARVRLARMYSKRDKALEGEIELLDFQESPDVSAMNMEEKLEYGNRLKEVGNQLFKNDLLRRARAFYEEGASVFQDIDKLKEIEAADDQAEELNSGDSRENEGDDGKVEGNKDTDGSKNNNVSESQKITQLYIQCKLNLALCGLKQADYLMAITACSEVIALDDHNVKALFRRAQAYTALREHGEALRDLSHVVRQEGKTSLVVAKLIKEVKLARERERKAQARTFSGMFEKLHLMSDEDASPRIYSPPTSPSPQDSVRRMTIVIFSIFVVAIAVVLAGLAGFIDSHRR